MSLDQETRPPDPKVVGEASEFASDEHALLNAWDRLIAIAALYPARNSRFQSMVGEWRAKLSAVSPLEKVTIEVGRDERLAHAGRVHDPDQVAKSRFYPLLIDTGVESVQLARAISFESLHRFISIFRELAQLADRSIGFQRLELPEMPPGVEVRLRYFSNGVLQSRTLGADGRDEDADEDAEGMLLVPRSAAEGTEEEVSSSDQTRNPHIGAQTEAGRTLEDMLTMGAGALHKRLTEDGVHPESALPSSEPLDMLDLIPELAPSTAPQIRDASRDFDIAELQRQAADSKDQSSGFRPETREPVEWLALLLKLILHEDMPTCEDRLREELSSALGSTPDLQAMQILLSGLEEMLERGSPEAVDHQLPRILAAVREHPELESRLLAELFAGADAPRLELLWPHLVDGLLRGRSGLLDAVLAEARHVSLALDDERRSRVLPRLEALPALQEGRLHASVYSPRQSALNPIYTTLLLSSRAQTAGSLLVGALQVDPPAQPHAALLALLGDYRPGYRSYLECLLASESDAGDETGKLLASAVPLSLRSLNRLRPNERNRPEVERVLALVRHAGEGAEDLLERICSERRFLVLHAWPAQLRRAAKRMLGRRGAGRAKTKSGGEVSV